MNATPKARAWLALTLFAVTVAVWMRPLVWPALDGGWTCIRPGGRGLVLSLVLSGDRDDLRGYIAERYQSGGVQVHEVQGVSARGTLGVHWGGEGDSRLIQVQRALRPWKLTGILDVSGTSGNPGISVLLNCSRK